MRIRNTTTISDRAIRDVVAFVRPPGIGGFTVRVQNHGRGNYGLASGDSNRILLRPPAKGSRNDTDHRRAGGYLPFPPIAGRLEWLVFIAAHELRHLWQARVPKGRRVWGSRGQFSERDADAYAIRMLRAWRRR